MLSIHCNLMKNSFSVVLSYLPNTRFYSECECLCICSHNRLEDQLNAVVSRFPLELTFPVELWAYSIFENVMGEPKAIGEFHGAIYCYGINVLLKQIFYLASGSNRTRKTKYISCITLYANIEYGGASYNKASIWRALVCK